MDSILTSIKKLLGIAEEDEHFDSDIIMYINTAFAILNQLNVGPWEGFMITDNEAKWDDILMKNVKLETVKMYVYFKVKLMFDPPLNSSTVEAINRTLSELEWRILNVSDPYLNGEEELQNE